MGICYPTVTGRSVFKPATVVAVWLIVNTIAMSADAHTTADDWWSGLPHMTASEDTLGAPRWYDALDVAAGLSAGSGAGAVAADLSLRLRLDIDSYLERVTAERADLDRIDRALARQRVTTEQLTWLSKRCEGAWRAWQVRLLDSLLAPSHESDGETGYLASLRALLAVDATNPATVPDVAACRLPGVLERLALAREHPAITVEAASRSLSDRTAAAMASQGPASMWLHVELASEMHGPRTVIRAGLDVPIPVREGGLDVSVSSDAQGVRGRIAWQRSGLAAGSASSRRAASRETAPDQADAVFGEAFTRRRLEALLLAREAERSWDLVCGAIEPHAVVVCLAAASKDTGGDQADDALIDALLRAIDAELAALRTLLGAIEASGHGLETLIHER